MNGSDRESSEGLNPLELFPYGVMIAAAMDGGKPLGILLTWAMQVSFNPPLIAAALERSSRMRAAVASSGRFTLSFLPRSEGASLAREFLQASRNESQISDPIVLTHTGIPYAAGAIAWLACSVRQEIATGDHDTVVGEVIESGGIQGVGEVLLLKDTGWRYRH